jgi:hypothetical protein
MIPMEECFIYQFGQWFLQHDVTICYPLCHCYPLCLMTGIQYLAHLGHIEMFIPVAPVAGTMWHLMQPQFEGKDPLPLPPEDPEVPRPSSRWLLHIDPSQPLSSGQHDVPHRLQGRADPGVLQKSPAAVVFSHQLSSPQQEV